MPERSAQGHQLQNLSLPSSPTQQCKNAKTILEYTHKTASSLLESYEKIRKERCATVGTSTDQEQDLLRAMLVMAAAGLDGMAKQLIRDTMPNLVATDSAVRDGLETFVARQIRGDTELPETIGGTKFMARLLAAPSHQGQAIEEYIHELTGGSLQSAGELIRIANALGMKPEEIGLDKSGIKQVQDIFAIRNKIIHELDMNLGARGGQRKRQQRKVEDMKEHVDKLLAIGSSLMDQANQKLKQIERGRG